MGVAVKLLKYILEMLIGDMGVDLCSRDIAMTEHGLN